MNVHENATRAYGDFVFYSLDLKMMNFAHDPFKARIPECHTKAVFRGSV